MKNKFKRIIFEYLILPLGDLFFGTAYLKSLKEWRRIQLLSEIELNLIQQEKLSKILNHTRNHISFYSNLKLKSNISLSDFPILTKAMIKENIDSFLYHPEKKKKLICEKSSGSSGIQGEVYMSKLEQSKVQALQTLMWEWAGYEFGVPMLQTGMTANRTFKKRIKDFLLSINYQLAFGMAPAKVIEALKENDKINGSIIGGYSSSMYTYAKIAKENGLVLNKFKSVISWGDKMFNHYKVLIEEVFSCKVFQLYGTTEGFVIAGQKDLDYFYIFTPQVYLELLDVNGKEVEDGEIGNVVVTHLDAYEMPLIRYSLGDLAIKLPKQEYPNKRDLQFPLLMKIIGRDTDIVYTKSGKSLIVHFFTGIFEHYSEIKQFRVIQNDLSFITIEYIPENSFNIKVLREIEDKIILELGEKIVIKFVSTDIIPNTPSGKPQIISSTLNFNRINHVN
jgi:phenylacetate-CoA ligase